MARDKNIEDLLSLQSKRKNGWDEGFRENLALFDAPRFFLTRRHMLRYLESGSIDFILCSPVYKTFCFRELGKG